MSHGKAQQCTCSLNEFGGLTQGHLNLLSGWLVRFSPPRTCAFLSVQHIPRAWWCFQHGFPVDEIWQDGLINETEDDDEDDECPQDQIMTVRQTSPVIAEPEFVDEEKIDIDSHEIIKPTLQSVVWLAELVATTSMKNERKKGSEVGSDKHQTNS